MIKILIVEDTPVIRKYIEFIFESVPGMEVIGTAANGEEAIEFLKHRIPDVITMDIHMPKMDGFEATRYIMETTPLPIVIVSGSTDPSEVAVTFKAVEAGAVGITLRPPGIGHPDHESEAKKLVELVRLLSEVKVVRRRGGNGAALKSMPDGAISNGTADTGIIKNGIDIIAIGASTGGPPVIKSILEKLPAGYGAPVLVVQHIARGFTEGFAEWLNSSSKLSVCVAKHGEPALPGRVYIAPDDLHMGISPDGILSMRGSDPEHGLRPSVSYLFRSAAESFGPRAAGVILTGMGSDGADALLLMRQRGGVTIAQDAESSVVHGMPGEAIKLNAAMYVLAPEMIAAAIGKLVTSNRRDLQ
ncbi:MAG TPA: chemotaxis-specific protein-glutamate methyltransferase CheB [Bacteroidales bacterium]|nr:chemotaxis-specific protein-glutamate methyltransferase CheB [Bacteroidales bacterium]